MKEEVGVDYIRLSEVISSPTDMSPPIARVGSLVLVKCGKAYREGTIIEIKSPTIALVVFLDDDVEERHQVEGGRMTLMRGS